MFPVMKSRPHFSPASPCPQWICCAAVLLLSLSSDAAPPLPNQPAIVPIENKPPVGQSLGTSAATFTNSMDVLNDTVKLGAGDRVSLRIIEEKKNEPYSLFVSDGGEIEVPHIGRVQALDKTCKQVANEIKPLLERDYFVKATVILGLDLIGTKSRGKVYLTGQVRSPGVLELLPGDPMTLSQAILRANGVGDFADKRNVRLVRRKDGLPVASAEVLRKMQPKKKESFFKNLFSKKKEVPNDSTDTFTVDLVDILEKGHLERDPLLKVGDLIFVPERLINY